MPSSRLPPHLVSDGKIKRCSDCGLGFRQDSQPSLSEAFAEHVRKEHKAIPLEVVPVTAIPKTVLNGAVPLGKREPKGRRSSK